MRMHRSLLFSILITLIGFSTPSMAEACGTCMFAIFDRILPPIHLWSFFPIIWFLAPSIAVMIRGGKVDDIPPFITAAAVVFGLLLVGAMSIGPLGLILLLIPCLYISTVIISREKPRTWDKRLVRDLKIISFVGWFFFVGLVWYTVYIHSSRSPSDYILKWEPFGPGERLLKKLARSSPKALADLRKILKTARYSPTLEIAAEGFQTFGEPETDVPLLIDTFAKCSVLGSLPCISKVEAALRELSGLDLPEGTPAAIWWRNWNEIKIEDT
jgi:hypothetical protein